MGMNAIRCEGKSYAEVKESRLGEGGMSSSDFNGKDVLKGAVLVGLTAVFAAGCIDNDDAEPRMEAKYRFNRFGDTKTVHDEATNKTYEFELNGLSVQEDFSIVRMAHFAIYDVGEGGKVKIGDIRLEAQRSDSPEITLLGTQMDLSATIGKGYVDLKVTEQ